MKFKTSFIVAAVAAISSLGTQAQADIPGAHPMYRHALADLREARGLLTPTTYVVGANKNEDAAIQEIDYAIRDIKIAGADDGKVMQDRVTVDPGLDHPGRLHRALQVMRRARSDAGREEQNSSAIVQQQRATLHIDAAINHDKQAIRDLGGVPG